MSFFPPWLRLATPLTLLLLTGGGCDGDTSPAQDVAATAETLCDGTDDDGDGRIDEGLLNACLGCGHLETNVCTLTSVMLQGNTSSPVMPTVLQYRIYEPEQRVIMGQLCTFERIQSIQPVVLTQPLMLRQGRDTGAWSSDPALTEDGFNGIVLDGNTLIELFSDSEDFRLTLEPPAQQSTAAQNAVERCVDHFDASVERPARLEFDEPAFIFIGGSTQLEADDAEVATSFFILSGETESGSLDIGPLMAGRPYAPDAVRCTISHSSSTSRPIDENGIQLSAQTSVASALSLERSQAPDSIRAFQSIAFMEGQITVSLSALDEWGSPKTMEFTRSGEVVGGYESQKLACTLGTDSEALTFDPADVFPFWQGTNPPQEIVRLNWTQIQSPLSMHPNLTMREALTIQRNRPSTEQ